MEKHNENSTFVPPRHWIGPEELEASYWNDPKVREKRGQEFFEKPIEYLENLDKSGQAGIARRDFLTIMGASMAMASFACARRPVHKIIPYVVKPEEITLGVANWYASTCNECSRKCGVLVKTREGRPIKLEGNPDHPINHGALCARGQASVLNLYDPDRLKAPLIRSRSTGASKTVAWNELDAVVVAKLKSANKVRLLTGEVASESTQRLIKDFLGLFPNGAHVQYEPLSFEEISEAQALSYGTAVTPAYSFEKAEVIVSLGADFMANWLSPVEHMGQWSLGRKLDSSKAAQAKLSKMFCFESTMTVTGSNADERFAVRPGDEYKVALALANEIVKQSPYANDAAVTSVVSGYTAEAVGSEIGLEPAKIKEVAHELLGAKGKSLVVGGGVHSRTVNAVALQVAVNLLNSALGNEGVTVDGTARVGAPKPKFADLQKLVQEMNQGLVEVLIVQGTNPAYTLPKAVGFEEALKKVPTVIAISEREDEMALLSDFVLADHHYLENWGDASPRKGLYSLQQPTIAPIHSSRAFQDTLMAWGKAMGKASGLLAQSADWHAYLQGVWRELQRQAKASGSFDQFWESALRDGVLVVDANAKPAPRSFRTAAVGSVPKYAKSSQTGTLLALYSSVSMYDGRSANNAWLQELPDPISSVTWDNYLNVAPTTAKQLSLHENDVVEVRSGDLAVELPVHIQPGMHPSVVSVAVGYGRRAAGKVGNLNGIDVYPFVKAEGTNLSFSGQAVALKKTGRIYQLANTQWHTATENRPVINDITLTEFKKNPASANHTDPHLRMETVPSMWPAHEYKGYRWAMGIDLNSCTGCSACMIGCQAENNIPVVGRDQVRVSRQMHWIRIDRYYSGTVDNPEVVFQPMLCQHCENAPCETVCPVLATVHDDEGLNVQVYNRCVGTRYCQNNCPYKVRRFNFFDHWKSYEGTMNLVWNPDVTVRTRGIMEKCTFCVQRLRDAKGKAKDQGKRMADGEVKTACQQTCPTDAIVFGDINDPNSRISKLREDGRAFRVLEVLNAKPMISYLTKVRNKEGSAHGGVSHHG